MKIATLGNCQALIVSWYVRRLFENRGEPFECKWVGSYFANHQFPYLKIFEEQEQSILKKDLALSYIKEADYIIYQHLEKDTVFNFNNLPKLIKKDCNLLSIGFFRHDLAFPTYFSKERLSNFYRNIRISPSYIAQKYSDETGFQKFKDGVVGHGASHPNAFYFLCLMKEICNYFNWEYYPEELSLKLKKIGYPFEKRKGWPPSQLAKMVEARGVEPLSR